MYAGPVDDLDDLGLFVITEHLGDAFSYGEDSVDYVFETGLV